MDERVFSFLDKMYHNNPIDLNNITLNDFSIKVLPFIHLVDHWASIMGLLLAKCQNYQYRRRIIKNLYDENCAELTHVETFYSFMCQASDKKVMDSMKDVMEKTKNNYIVSKYKEMILHFINNNNFDDCCQMLGAAEYTYLLISNDIANLYLNYTSKKPNKHYNINDTYQRQHANNFFDCVVSQIKQENLEFGVNWIVYSMNELLDH